MTVEKTTNIAQEFERKNKCLQSISKLHFEPINNVISSKSTLSKNINLHDFNNRSSLLNLFTKVNV